MHVTVIITPARVPVSEPRPLGEESGKRKRRAKRLADRFAIRIVKDFVLALIEICNQQVCEGSRMLTSTESEKCSQK